MCLPRSPNLAELSTLKPDKATAQDASHAATSELPALQPDGRQEDLEKRDFERVALESVWGWEVYVRSILRVIVQAGDHGKVMTSGHRFCKDAHGFEREGHAAVASWLRKRG